MNYSKMKEVENVEELWWSVLADEEARSKLVEKYLYVAEREARKYEGFSDMDYDDLYSQAVIYVIEAVDKWRPGSCHKYISSCVLNHVAVKMKQFVANQFKSDCCDCNLFDWNVDDSVSFVENRMVLKNLFDKVSYRLTDKEKMVLSMYYGFWDGDPKTTTYIARKMNVTKERINQIRRKALAKLKSPRNWLIKGDPRIKMYERFWLKDLPIPDCEAYVM